MKLIGLKFRRSSSLFFRDEHQESKIQPRNIHIVAMNLLEKEEEILVDQIPQMLKKVHGETIQP